MFFNFHFFYMIALSLVIGCSGHDRYRPDDMFDQPVPERTARVSKLTLVKCLNGGERDCVEAGRIEKERRSYKKAFRYFLMACNLDFGLGCYEAGMLEGKADRKSSAKSFFEKGCQYKDGLACFELGSFYQDTKEYQLSRTYYGISCDYNMGIGCKKLAEVYVAEGLKDKAMKYYGRACQLADQGSCHNAGLMALEIGNEKKAEEFFALSCKREFARGCYNLSCLFSRQKKIEEALDSFEKALSFGFTDWNQIEFDPDLKNMRLNRRYRHILKTFRPPDANEIYEDY